MKDISTKQLRSVVSQYARPNNFKALSIFAIDMSIYLSAIAGVILYESVLLKIICSIIAGSIISTIFVIGHDAAHGALTSNKLLNKVVARLAFLPSHHNYSLWLIAHNQIHHQFSNVKKLSSWSPLSKEEYDALPKWRQSVEKLYRSVAGICFYYLAERWLKDKFYPFKRTVGQYKTVYWLDFLLVSISLLAFLGLLIFSGSAIAYNSPLQMLILGFTVPFLIWNFMMGFTVYQHHTHETIMWTRTREQRDQIGHQEDFTMHVKFPGWYNHSSHYIMEHTAHHVDPRIPFYNLLDAQKDLFDVLGEDMKIVPFSITKFLKTMKLCKLYDYENHCWMDFDGVTTYEIIEEAREPESMKLAA